MSGVIKIIKFEGKRGGFATRDTTLYRVEVIGIDGSIRFEPSYSELKYTVKTAQEWAGFTGWPIKYFEIKTVHKEEEIEVGEFGGTLK